MNLAVEVLILVACSAVLIFAALFATYVILQLV